MAIPKNIPDHPPIVDVPVEPDAEQERKPTPLHRRRSSRKSQEMVLWPELMEDRSSLPAPHKQKLHEALVLDHSSHDIPCHCLI